MIKELAMGIMLLASTVTAKAETIPMSIDILPDFGMGVDVDRFKFLPISGGNGSSAAVGLNVSSNKDTQWAIMVSAPEFIREGGVEKLPKESVTYRVDGGLGQKIPPSESGTILPSDDTTIYVSGTSEQVTAGTMITFTVNIAPPRSQKAGRYTSTLKVTLIDNF